MISKKEIRIDNSPTHPPRCYVKFEDSNFHCIEFDGENWVVDGEKQEPAKPKVIFSEECNFSGEFSEWDGVNE